MKANQKVAIALIAGLAAGGAFVHELRAQATPPAYVVVDISKITDAEGFKAIPAKAGPATLAPFGGKYIIRTEKNNCPRWYCARAVCRDCVPQRGAGKSLEGFSKLEGS